jgi:hypothetical protein
VLTWPTGPVKIKVRAQAKALPRKAKNLPNLRWEFEKEDKKVPAYRSLGLCYDQPESASGYMFRTPSCRYSRINAL